EHEEVQRQVEIHDAVLDEHGTLAGGAVDDAWLAVRGRSPVDNWCDRFAHTSSPRAGSRWRPPLGRTYPQPLGIGHRPVAQIEGPPPVERTSMRRWFWRAECVGIRRVSGADRVDRR